MTQLILTDETKALASVAMLEAVEALQENLESVEDPRPPKIKFKEGFTLAEGENHLAEFEAIIVFAKNANAWYQGKYDPRDPQPPDCASSDGKVPDRGEEKQAESCKVCPRNEFKKDGSGKDCKNMKVLFLLQPGGIIPKTLSIPPTSLKAVNNYLMNLAASGVAYHQVLTSFEAWKQDDKQTHYNIKLTKVEVLPEDAAKDAKFIKAAWNTMMRGVVDGE